MPRLLLRFGRDLATALLLPLVWLGLGLPALGFALGFRATPPPVAVADAAAGRLERVGGLWHLHLAGPPAAMGRANGERCAPLVARLERDLHGSLTTLVPSFAARHLVLGMVAGLNADLEHRLRPSERDEIAGLAAGIAAAGDVHAAVGPLYGRLLHYHALHDASQNLIDNPLVRTPAVGCSAVAVVGGASVDGHLLVGRLFDFEGGRGFDEDKMVVTCAPEGGLRFVSVAWGGLVGAVTGFNEAGLWVSLNAAATDHRRLTGRPVTLVVREILETCRRIDDAVEVLSRSELAVSEAVLLASRDERTAVVAEAGPGGLALRRMQGGRLAVTNHFLAPRWQGDAANAARIAGGTTAARLSRLGELVAGPVPLAAAGVLDVLRDRRGPGGVDRGFGHRGTINAWIGAHLAVADLDAGIIWVCEVEHGLGRARAFGLDGPRRDVADLPASPDLDLCRSALPAWRDHLDRARAALAAGKRDEALAQALAAAAANPGHYEAWGIAATACTDRVEARRLWRRALAGQPAYAGERAAITAALEESGG